MPAGSIWEVYIPQELAYGEREQNIIKPFSALIFKIELLEVNPKKPDTLSPSEQMGEMDMTDRQRYIMEYLIGSLDDDGLLRKELYAISDELAVYHNIDVTEHEIAEVLAILQEFDPAGIGARTLQECLLHTYVNGVTMIDSTCVSATHA